MDTPADRLQEAREDKGIETAVEAARQLHVNKTTYQNWEDGSRSFRRHVLKLAAFYGVRPQWLLDGKLPKKAPEIQRRYDALTETNQTKLLDYMDMLEAKQRT